MGEIDEAMIFDTARTPDEIQQLYEQETGLSGDPPFADLAGGDYHLLSERGRYLPEHDVWVLDDVTSPAVDGGDPAMDPGAEPMPNGGRVNMGAYGNTAFASRSEWPLKTDVNRDGVYDHIDFALGVHEWVAALPWVE